MFAQGRAGIFLAVEAALLQFWYHVFYEILEGAGLVVWARGLCSRFALAVGARGLRSRFGLAV